MENTGELCYPNQEMKPQRWKFERSKSMKKLLSLMLAFVMVIGMFAGTGMEAKAVSEDEVVTISGTLSVTFTPGANGEEFYNYVKNTIYPKGWSNGSIYKSNTSYTYIKCPGGSTVNLESACKSTSFSAGTYEVFCRTHNNKAGDSRINFWHKYTVNVSLAYTVGISVSGAPSGYGGVKVNGSAAGSSVKVAPGGTVAFEVIAVPGHKANVSYGTASCSVSGNTYTFSNVNQQFDFKVTYEATDYATVTFSQPTGATISVNGETDGSVQVISGLPYTVKVTADDGYGLSSISVDGTAQNITNAKEMSFTVTAGAKGSTHTVAATAKKIQITVKDTGSVSYSSSMSTEALVNAIFDEIYTSSEPVFTKEDIKIWDTDEKALEIQVYGENAYDSSAGAQWVTLQSVLQWGTTESKNHSMYMWYKDQIKVRFYSEGAFSNECTLHLTSSSIGTNAVKKDYTGKAVALSLVKGVDFTWTSTAAKQELTVYKYYDSNKTELDAAPIEAGSYYVKVRLTETTYYGEYEFPSYCYSDLIPLTITKEGLQMKEIKDFTCVKTYDGEAAEPDFTVVLKGNQETEWTFTDGKCTNFPLSLTPVYAYKKTTEPDTSYTSTAPTCVGTYDVKVTLGTCSKVGKLTINPCPVTITGVQVASSKVYDGTTDAQITSNGTLSVNYDGENLTFVPGTASYSDKNAGAGKTVSFRGFTLGGAAVENYTLSSQPASVTADITEKELTVSVEVDDKQYDGLNTATIKNDSVHLNGIVGNEAVSVSYENVTANFTSADVGEEIKVTFTGAFELVGEADVLKNYTLKQPESVTAAIYNHYEAEKGTDYTVNSNDWINTDFVVTAGEGYEVSRTNTADAENWSSELRETEDITDGTLNFYVRNKVTGAISKVATELYKIDKTEPAGTIEIAENTWNSFLNEITFGLFFNETQTVTITPGDEGSGIAKVEYYESAAALTAEEVKNLPESSWISGSSTDVTLEDAKKFVYYARITDVAGNVACISSNGCVYDITDPEILNVEEEKTYYVTTKVEIADTNLTKVTLNGAEQFGEDGKAASWLLLPGNTDTSYTIEVTDAAGNVTAMTVCMKPISALSDELKDLTKANVTTKDEKRIKELQSIVEELQTEDATEEEKELSNTLSEKCKTLLKKIKAIKAAQAAKTGSTVKIEDTVETGDKNNVEVYVMLLAAASVLIAAILRKYRKAIKE